MPETNDTQLLRDFAVRQSDAAFAALVARHINLVYSVALRRTGNPHAAEEITHAVFIILARKAATLGPRIILSGWLYQTARLTAANFLRTERRRTAREQEAYMQSLTNEPGAEAWPQIAPLLDDAMARLGAMDRDAVVLRYMEGKSLQEVGAALGASEAAARMRVNRALEKLRRIFSKRGVTLATAAIAGAMAANSAGAAPAGLAAATAAAAVKDTAATGSTFALVHGTLKFMARMKLKFAALLVGTTVLPVGGVIIMVLFAPPPPRKPLRSLTPATTPVEPREPFTATVHTTLGVPPGAVALRPDGKIVIGTTLSGFFIDEQSGVIGSYRRAAIRTCRTAPGTAISSARWTTSTPQTRCVLILEIAADGRMLLSGLFKSVNDVPRPGYAMLLPDGRVDESFEPFRGTTNQWRNNYPATATRAATLLPGGSVAVLNNSLDSLEGRQVLTGYQLEPSGMVITTPQTNPAPAEFGRPSGLVATLGPLGFWTRRPVDWARDSRAGARPEVLAAMPSWDFPFERWQEAPSAADAAAVFQTLFSEMPLELCRYAVRLPDGGTVMAIRTEMANGSRIGGGSFMRFDKEWRPNLTFTNHYEADLGSCITLKLQPDGKILVAGLAGKFNGEDFPGLVRLEKDGAVDRGFHCVTTARTNSDPTINLLTRRVIDLAIQDDGRIVIAGFFTHVNGVECPYLARLNPDGSVDETFRTPFTTWEGLKKWRRVPVQSLTKAKLSPRPTAQTIRAPSSTAEENATPSQTVLITSLQLNDGVAVIQFVGNPRQVYILQAATSLHSSDWINLSTNTANATGNGFFRDESAKDQPLRFYRIAVP